MTGSEPRRGRCVRSWRAAGGDYGRLHCWLPLHLIFIIQTAPRKTATDPFSSNVHQDKALDRSWRSRAKYESTDPAIVDSQTISPGSMWACPGLVDTPGMSAGLMFSSFRAQSPSGCDS